MANSKKPSSKKLNNASRFTQSLYVQNTTPDRMLVPQIAKLISDKNVIF
ncbi:hypothetical protein [Wolbachia endosymbiont of Brugia malayi]|nr:hypothetical protein [Wolbachia endosymbiont of Brugia malayi]